MRSLWIILGGLLIIYLIKVAIYSGRQTRQLEKAAQIQQKVKEMMSPPEPSQQESQQVAPFGPTNQIAPSSQAASPILSPSPALRNINKGIAVNLQKQQEAIRRVFGGSQEPSGQK